MFTRGLWITGIWWSLLIIITNNKLHAAPSMDSSLLYVQQAWEAQNRGDLQPAIQIYEAILKQGYCSAELYNNLGLAYAKMGQLGKAILQWERALHYQPYYTEAQHNLQAAQQHISRPITATPSIALVQGWLALRQTCSAQTWGFLFLLLWGLSWGLGVYLWKKNQETWKTQKETKVIIGLLALSLLIFVLGLGQQRQEQEQNIAIVIAKEAGLRPYPKLSSEEMEILSEGVRLRLIEEEGDWIKVELPNYLVGWVPNRLVERL